MYWFKNAIIYRLTKKLDWSLTQLQQHLEQCAYINSGFHLSANKRLISAVGFYCVLSHDILPQLGIKKYAA